MLSNKLMHIRKGVVLLCFSLVASSLVSISQIHARTVTGQLWDYQCGDATCAVAGFCDAVQENIDRNPDSRNLVCPSNGVMVEIDRLVENGNPSVTTEPFIFYKVDFVGEYEAAYGGAWITRTFSH